MYAEVGGSADAASSQSLKYHRGVQSCQATATNILTHIDPCGADGTCNGNSAGEWWSLPPKPSSAAFLNTSTGSTSWGDGGSTELDPSSVPGRTARSPVMSYLQVPLPHERGHFFLCKLQSHFLELPLVSVQTRRGWRGRNTHW